MSAAPNPLLPILTEGDPERPQLVGIARLAASGKHLDDGHNVEYFTIPVRSLLNKCTAPRMPFTWTINPYRGCEFACKYCYARYTHEFMELRDGVDFERKIFVKSVASTVAPSRGSRTLGQGEASAGGAAECSPAWSGVASNARGAAECRESSKNDRSPVGTVEEAYNARANFADIAYVLRRDLKRVKPGEEIAIGTATDPYQPAERRFGVTRAIMEELAQHRDLDIGVVTKSTLVTRDIDVLQRIHERNRIFINLTITTTDANLARILEPRAPRPDLRLETVRKLNQAGIPAGVICAPVLPGITDSDEQLESLVRAAAQAGAQYIFANALFLKPCSAAVFLPFLEKEFPHLARRYERMYGDKAFLEQGYRKRLSHLMAKLRKRYGLVNRTEEYRAADPTPDHAQLALFG